MKLEGGAAAPGRPRAGECPRGAPVPGREPWGRAVGRRAGALGSGEASGLGGAGLRRAGVFSPALLFACQLIRRSLHSFFLFPKSFLLPAFVERYQGARHCSGFWDTAESMIPVPVGSS